MVTVEKFLQVAQAEVGYTEGKNNKNKFGKEYGLDNNPWCQIFVWWVSKHSGLKENIDFPKTASCPRGLIWFRERGRLFKTPMVGDYIYFKWTSNKETEASHVGIVEAIKDGRVYTIEGNAGSASDRVIRKNYSLKYACIVGYARLPLDRSGGQPEPPKPTGTDADAVKALQTALNKAYKCGLAVDGIIGTMTTKAVNGHLVRYGSRGAYVKWIQQRLTDIGWKGSMLTPDGICGERTTAAIKAFQKARGLEVDGVVGINTIKQLVMYP